MIEKACLDCGEKFMSHNGIQVRCGHRDTKGTCAYKHRRHGQKLFERNKRNKANMTTPRKNPNIRYCLGKCGRKTPHTKTLLKDGMFEVKCWTCTHQGNAVA